MNREFVNFENAVSLSKMGYSERTLAMYNPQGIIFHKWALNHGGQIYAEDIYNQPIPVEFYAAPDCMEAIFWLMERIDETNLENKVWGSASCRVFSDGSGEILSASENRQFGFADLQECVSGLIAMYNEIKES